MVYISPSINQQVAYSSWQRKLDFFLGGGGARDDQFGLKGLPPKLIGFGPFCLIAYEQFCNCLFSCKYLAEW